MAVNTANAFVGRPALDRGMFYRAEKGTPFPSTALEALNVAYKDHGAVSENGLTVTPTRDTQDIKMAGGGTFVTIQQNFDETVTVELLEDWNVDVLDTVFGGQNVEADESEDGQTTIYHTDEPLPISNFVLVAVSGNKTKLYAFEGQVINVAEIKVLHSDVTRASLTIKTYESELTDGKRGNVLELRDGGGAGE